MKRRWPRLCVVAILASLAVATLSYRSAYGTWWQTPLRIPYCGRTYLVGTEGLNLADVERNETATALPGDQPYPVNTVGKAPPIVGQPILAAVVPEPERQQIGLPCAMAIYLKTGDNSYTAYGLSGGP